MMHCCRLGVLGVAGLFLAVATRPAGADNVPAPRRPDGGPLDPAALAREIDRAIDAQLEQREVKPAPRANDAEFLRRVYLDLTGRIPRVSEVRAFLTDKYPDKRRLIVEKLLADPEFVHQYVGHFVTTWTGLLLSGANNQQNFANNFRPWVEQQVRDNVPYDRMVRSILTAPLPNQPGVGGGGLGGRPQQGPVPTAYYQSNEQKAENLAGTTARLFLGVNLACAQCHHHPFADWKKEQFWQFAAFFAGAERRRTEVVDGRVRVLPAPDPFAHSIKIPNTDKVIEAKFLDGKEPKFEQGVSPRATLADWMTSPDNPYFARTAANRLWAHFFGVGLIDPVDDEATDENPASHPELLRELARQFIANKYDVKYLIRALTQTRAYQRTSAATDPAQADVRLYARMPLRGLTAEQLFDSLAEATGYREQTTVVGGRVVPVGGQGSPRAQFLQKFTSQDKKTEHHTSILQALSLMNGKFVSDATSLERSHTLAAVADAPFLSTEQKVEALYLAALSRLPRAEEAARMTGYVNGGGPRSDRSAALADVFWVLLNSSEFMFNH
jgi:hypothetical protein